MLAGQVSDVRFDEVASRAVLQVPARLEIRGDVGEI